MIIYSTNPTFVPSFSEIGDLSCITSFHGSAWFSHEHTLKQNIRDEKEPRIEVLLNVCFICTLCKEDDFTVIVTAV